MKFVLMALASANALRYAVSEGPTKVDFGEDDENVLPRAPEGWSNPLGWEDTGVDDDTVLLSLQKQHRDFLRHKHNPK